MVFFVLEKVDALYRKWFPPEFDCYHIFIWTTEYKFDVRFEAMKHFLVTGIFAFIFSIILMINYLVIPTPVLDAGKTYEIVNIYERVQSEKIPGAYTFRSIDIDDETENELIDYLMTCDKRGDHRAIYDAFDNENIELYLELDNPERSDRLFIRTGEAGTVNREDGFFLYRLLDGDNVTDELYSIMT